ncbi:MAG: peptide chain release factor 1 [Ignavibacteriales bacterium]
MIERLELLEQTYDKLASAMMDPAVFSVPQEYQKVAREHKRLSPVVGKYREYKSVVKELDESRQLLAEDGDPEFRELVGSEVARLESERDRLEQDLRVLMLPRDPNDEKDVIVEVRAGTGGEEAALFAADLFRMYGRYAERQGWKTEMVSSSPTDIGGFKEIIFAVQGEGAYSRLKYESGVHRVQRIPVTESGGRIHTSTATVAVLPEAEEVDVQIDPNELRVDTFCASGHGGQSVNTTYSAVRVTHLPTGLVVSCQDEKSQLKNRERAMRVLRARLLDMAKKAQHEELAEARRSQVGTGERSERIRTYNFPQSRVTDHRIGLTVHNLDAVMDGDIGDILDALAADEQARLLAVAQ